MDVSEPGWQLPRGRDLTAFTSFLVPGLPQAGTERILQSWQLWASLAGQNSIPNCLFSSTSTLLKELHCTGVSKCPHCPQRCHQVTRHSPRPASSLSSRERGAAAMSPLHLWGVLGDTPFPSPACPFPASLQDGRGFSGNGGGC